MRAQGAYFLPVQDVGGYQHTGLAQLHARGNGFRAKGAEQRRHHHTRLERAQHRYIQGRQPTGEHKQVVSGGHTEGLQHVGQAVSLLRQRAVTHVQRGGVAGDKAQGGFVGKTLLQVTVNGQHGHVHGALGVKLQVAPGRSPGVLLALALVVAPMRGHAQVGGGFDDDSGAVHG